MPNLGMTPQRFKNIFKDFYIETYTDVLLDIETGVIQGWLAKKHPIPDHIAARLYRLHAIHQATIIDAINEAFDSPEKKVYWPTYLRVSDFKAIDPESYQLFMGSRWLYNRTIYKAENTFSSLYVNQDYQPCSVHAYTISTDIYYPWLERNGYQNNEARRKQYTKELFLRNRPMRSDTLHLLQQGKTIPSADTVGAQERRDKIQQMREKLGMVSPPKVRTTPTPDEVWTEFLSHPSQFESGNDEEQPQGQRAVACLEAAEALSTKTVHRRRPQSMG